MTRDSNPSDKFFSWEKAQCDRLAIPITLVAFLKVAANWYIYMAYNFIGYFEHVWTCYYYCTHVWSELFTDRCIFCCLMPTGICQLTKENFLWERVVKWTYEHFIWITNGKFYCFLYSTRDRSEIGESAYTTVRRKRWISNFGLWIPPRVWYPSRSQMVQRWTWILQILTSGQAKYPHISCGRGLCWRKSFPCSCFSLDSTFINFSSKNW